MHKQDIQPVIKSAVDKLVDFVKPTFGPKGKGVIIQYGERFASLDDGVSVAKAFTLEDPFENSVISFVKEAAIKTNDRVGDGTTGALIMLQALNNQPDLISVDKGLEAFKNKLKSQSKTIESESDLEKIAYVSFNNKEIAKVIASVVYKAGPDGVVRIEDSNSTETSTEFVAGLEVDKGYLSPYMITNGDYQAVYENIPVLLTDKKVSTTNEILPLMQELVKAGKKELFFIAEDVSTEVLSFFVLNKLQGNFSVLAVKAPSYGEKKLGYLEDIAILTGSEMVTDMNAKRLTTDVLGIAHKIVSKKDSTLIIGGDGAQAQIDERVRKLKKDLEETASTFDKDQIRSRISKLTGGVGLIRVGAATESETKNLKYKIEDAVNATQVALRGGYVQGGGITLKEIRTGSPALDIALQAPWDQLRESGVGEVGEEVIDATEVLLSQVESAVSIVKVLRNSYGILLEKKNG